MLLSMPLCQDDPTVGTIQPQVSALCRGASLGQAKTSRL